MKRLLVLPAILALPVAFALGQMSAPPNITAAPLAAQACPTVPAYQCVLVTVPPSGPTPTQSATPRPSATGAPTQAATLQPVALLQNPDFEGRVRPVIFPEINVFTGWEPWYCDQPYTASKCPIPLEWDPPWQTGGVMKRPEYKPANPKMEECPPLEYGNRVQHDCNSQQWFAANGVSRAGVYQVVQLTPGVTYEFGAYGQIWASDGVRGCTKRDAKNQCIERNSGMYTSDIATVDDREAAKMFLGVDLSCGTNAFSNAVQWSPFYGHAEGMYDRWQPMSLRFTATGNCATLYIGGVNKYAQGNNNFYTDTARLAIVGSQPEPTAQPTAQPTVRPTVIFEVTPISTPVNLCEWASKGAQSIKGDKAYSYTDPDNTGIVRQNVRSGPGVSYPVQYQIVKGAKQTVYWQYGSWVSFDLDCRFWADNRLGSYVNN